MPDPAAPSMTAVPASGGRLVDARQSLGAARLDDLFPEGSAFRASNITFVVLLAAAAFIATFGLFADSVAAIIGAMVVAPLGGAIMAFAGSIVTARLRWQAITFVQVVGGAAMVVAIGVLVSFLIPDPITLNASIDARTSPGLLDLGVALAAGAAGAFVAARRTGSDALPGVAIAVSLVPPLAVVGICLELGRIDDAGGALILFLTNFAAIVVAACIVFAMSGALPSRESLAERHHVRNGVITSVVALVLISIPLVWRSVEVSVATVRAQTGAPIVASWIGDRDLSVTSWAIAGDTVVLSLAGPDAPADPQTLATELAAAFGSPVTLDLVYVPSTHDVVQGSP